MTARAATRSTTLPWSALIVMLKFERIDPLVGWFADRLAEIGRREGETLAADIVVPVPLHRQRERERGYNQADLIARPPAKRLGLPTAGSTGAEADHIPISKY